MPFFSRKTEVQEPLQDHTVYLIDTENVRTVWTLLLDRMSLNDKIYVFYTMNSGNVSYEDLNGVISSGKNVELIQCHTGKNGLDFQLVSYLGYLIRNNENADYCIISDDNGYDAVIKFWEGREVKVSRKTAFQVSGKQAKAPKKSLFGVKPRAKAKPAAKVETETKAASEEKPSQPKKPVAKKTAAPKAEPKQDAKPATPKQEAKPETKQTKTKTASPKPATPKTSTAKSEAKPEGKAEEAKPAANKPAATKPAATKTAATSVNVSADKLREFLPDESEENIRQISDIIKKSGGKKGLADIHDEIEKLYRNEKASDIYRIVRHNIKDICT